MVINWIAIIIISIWFAAALGTAFSKDSQCMGAAALTTIAIGIGYLILKNFN